MVPVICRQTNIEMCNVFATNLKSDIPFGIVKVELTLNTAFGFLSSSESDSNIFASILSSCIFSKYPTRNLYNPNKCHTCNIGKKLKVLRSNQILLVVRYKSSLEMLSKQSSVLGKMH